MKMNREILFRGKRTDIGIWEYGNLSIRDEVGREKYYIGQNMLGYEITSETIGQYTGLTDKNGVKIFEGDILSTDLKRPYAVVVFRDGAFEYELDDGDGIYYDIMCPILKEATTQDKYLAVIGNIHDNSELMVGTENEVN